MKILFKIGLDFRWENLTGHRILYKPVHHQNETWVGSLWWLFSILCLFFFLQAFDLLLSTCMEKSRGRQSTWRNYSVISLLRENLVWGGSKERDGSIEIGSVTKLQSYQCTVVYCEKCLFFLFFQLWAKLTVLNKTKAKRATFHAVMKMWYRGVIMNTGVNRMVITNRTSMHTKPSAHKGKDQAARN